jgi:preprotein translocase subunit SecD
MRDKNIRHAGIAREGDNIESASATRTRARRPARVIQTRRPCPPRAHREPGRRATCWSATIKPEAQQAHPGHALKQNITTLHNRINELGVAEPVIQQQGADRIVVQLPGVQDTAKAKDILGRTATLEIRMVDDGAQERRYARRGARGEVPFGTELFTWRAAARRWWCGSR